MSYILDALRKSDAQRRLGQPPDLNTPGPAPARPRRGRRRLWLPLVLIALVVVAVAVGGRLVTPLQQWFAGPEQAAAPDPAMVPDPPVAPTPPVGTLEIESAVAVAEDEDESEEGEEARAPVERPVTVVSRPAARRPGERSTPPRERERLVEDAEEAQRLIEAAQATAPAPSPAEATTIIEPAPAPAAPAEPWTPERAEFLRKWELPLAIRRDLPELRLSIHVFSGQPQDRFVLINGERRIEGDDLGQGARLVEIRREGALVAFRDYRFLLEP